MRDPTIVIKGKPKGQPVYNVFVVDGIAPLTRQAAGRASGSRVPSLKSTPVVAVTGPTKRALQAERKANKAMSWTQWARSVAPWHAQIKRQLKRRPKKLSALIGTDGFLFYRRSLDYVVGGDIQSQPAGKNPLATIVAFKDHLARHQVDFLLVPVPTKSEVFPDKLGVSGLTRPVVINPHGRKFLHALSKAGVEVVDLIARVP